MFLKKAIFDEEEARSKASGRPILLTGLETINYRKDSIF
jgi:hypothetical protein